MIYQAIQPIYAQSTDYLPYINGDKLVEELLLFKLAEGDVMNNSLSNLSLNKIVKVIKKDFKNETPRFYDILKKTAWAASIIFAVISAAGALVALGLAFTAPNVAACLLAALALTRLTVIFIEAVLFYSEKIVKSQELVFKKVNHSAQISFKKDFAKLAIWKKNVELARSETVLLLKASFDNQTKKIKEIVTAIDSVNNQLDRLNAIPSNIRQIIFGSPIPTSLTGKNLRASMAMARTIASA